MINDRKGQSEKQQHSLKGWLGVSEHLGLNPSSTTYKLCYLD